MIDKNKYRLDERTNVYVPSRLENYNFNYSDGNTTEEFLRKTFEEVSDLSSNSFRLSQRAKDWPSLYHLSSRRSNLLRPFHERLDGDILEIGAGCGAITRYLAETGKSVIGIEGSINRAELARLRCNDLSNVNMVCDNFSNFDEDNKFDIVTLIGVLEYAQVYYQIQDDEDPVLAMLKKAKNHLKKNGFLILAIENKLGLKYFAGYPEDHLGVPMAGIEGRYTNSSPITFGKSELSKIIEAAGFNEYMYYYPFPDYKLPVSILSDHHSNESKKNLAHLLSSSVSHDKQRPKQEYFDLSLGWEQVYDNGLWKDLANSFLIIMGDSLPVDDNHAYHYSIDRAKPFQKQVILDEKGSKKSFLSETHDNDADYQPFSVKLEDEPFIHGRNWELELNRILSSPNWSLNEVQVWFLAWTSALKKLIGYPGKSIPLNCKISGEYLDAIPKNLIVSTTTSEFIDLEWVYKGELNFQFMLFRALFNSLLPVKDIARSPNALEFDMKKWSFIKKLCLSMNYWVTNNDFIDYLDQEIEFQFQVANRFELVKVNSSFLEEEFVYKADPYLTSQLNDLNRELEHLSHQSNKLSSELNAIKDSLSYKLFLIFVSPLRFLKRIIVRDRNLK